MGVPFWQSDAFALGIAGMLSTLLTALIVAHRTDRAANKRRIDDWERQEKREREQRNREVTLGLITDVETFLDATLTLYDKLSFAAITGRTRESDEEVSTEIKAWYGTTTRGFLAQRMLPQLNIDADMGIIKGFQQAQLSRYHNGEGRGTKDDRGILDACARIRKTLNDLRATL